MCDHKFKIGNAIYDFENMIVMTVGNGWWHLKWNAQTSILYRIGNSRYIEQSPIVSAAYLDYAIENILLGDSDEEK